MTPSVPTTPTGPPRPRSRPLGDEVAIPPVFTAISLFCRAIGGLGLVVGLFGAVMVGLTIYHQGWGRIVWVPQGRGMVLAVAVDVLATAAYFIAAQALRDRRGTGGWPPVSSPSA